MKPKWLYGNVKINNWSIIDFDGVWTKRVDTLFLSQPKKVKNVSYDAFGTKEGQVHMKRQDYTKLQTRKMKGLKRKLDTAGTKRANKVKKKK